MTRVLVSTAWVFLLCACREDRPPAPTQEQSAKLNEIDNALDAMRNEKGPEANASGPSNSSD